MTPIIQVKNISKYYQKHVTCAKTFHEEFSLTCQKIKAKFTGTIPPPEKEQFKALDNVSFDIMPGEVVGIIGSNGAGKSTLLKILSRITMPTKGSVVLNGRVASLLEVGTGFHPELTGRENVFMNGAILGMKRAEIINKFNEIVAFSEVGEFIDTPVKRYSSGMYVRLAFAVAAHLEPEILIIDEVLAVGDVAFQRKCLGKMERVATGEGRTVLFVSHNTQAIQRLCTRCVLLEQGKLKCIGPTEEVLQVYGCKNKTELLFIPATPLGNQQVNVKQLELSPVKTNGDMLKVSITLDVLSAAQLNVCLSVRRQNELCFLANTYHSPEICNLDTGRHQLTFEIPPYLLNPGEHSFGIGVAYANGELICHTDDVLHATIEDDGKRRGNTYRGQWPGTVSPFVPISYSKL